MLNKRIIIALVCVVAVSSALFANLSTPRLSQAGAAGAPRIPAGNARAVTPSAHNGARATGTSPFAVQESLGALVTSVRPAVVNISAHPNAGRHPMQPGMQLLDPFPGRSGWVGSGVIIDPAGYILTSRQVVGNVDSVRVTLFRSGQNSFLARRVATDLETDLVLLKLPFGGSLPYAPIGDSSRVRSGDIVVAVGSPFGLAETVTQGIVSANRRTLQVEGRRYADVIQTDASINQGNCGGPLIDIRAQVIGINVAIYSTDSTFSGIGFAIASNRARAFFERAALGRR